jgi:hypothetical protein
VAVLTLTLRGNKIILRLVDRTLATRCIGITLWLVVGFWHALCQSGASPTSDVSAYETFFHQVDVVQVTPRAGDFTLLNGQGTSVSLPPIETRMGLSHDQAALLRVSALDCVAEIRSVDDDIRPLTFDARIQTIEYGEPAVWVIQRLADLNQKRNQVLVDHVQHLRVALGDAAFATLDTFVRTRNSHSAFSGADTPEKTVPPPSNEQHPLASQSEQRSALWKQIKEALLAPQGRQYFESSIKDALLPALAGTLISNKPVAHPNEFLIVMDDDQTPEVTLRLSRKLEKPLPPGTPVSFEGVAMEFTTEPFMLTFEVTSVDRDTVAHNK